MKIIDECHHLNHLIYLNFYSCSYADHRWLSHFQSVVDMIWNLPKLTHCNIDISIRGLKSLSIPSNVSTSLKYLNLYNNPLEWSQINKLFEYTPYLKRLSMKIVPGINDYYTSSSFPTLIDLKIIDYTSGTSRIISLLKNTHDLRRLHITLTSKLINGRKWEKIICNYLPKLKIFQFRMNDTLYNNQDIQEQMNKLVSSFRSSFWIDEHKWFIRCFISDTIIHLESLSNMSNNYEYKHIDSYQSTYPYDNQQEYYNNVNFIHNESLFIPSIPSNITLANIQELYITLPIKNEFWSIVSSLKRLHSLTVRSYTDSFYSQLQYLLDQAPNLYELTVRQDRSLPFQSSLFKLTNTAVRELYLDYYDYFNKYKCVDLTHSSLGLQCQILYIRVENLDNIIILVENMINLRVLYVDFTYEMTDRYWHELKNNDKVFGMAIMNKDQAIEWLKDHLPVTCYIDGEIDSYRSIQIWIK